MLCPGSSSNLGLCCGGGPEGGATRKHGPNQGTSFGTLPPIACIFA